MTELTASREPQTPSSDPHKVEILILGAGWLYQFLHPLLNHIHISHAGTTRNGHDNTIPFTFDHTSTDLQPYASLPTATTILITFPLPGASAPKVLLDNYAATHSHTPHPNTILLGSTGEYRGPGWHDRTSTPAGPPSERWQAENALLALPRRNGCVLNLAGLMGEPGRDAKIWDRAVPTTQDGLRAKASVHFVHGRDVARAVVAVHKRFAEAMGQRWVLTDERVYDWWELAWAEASRLDERLVQEERRAGGYRRWIVELMQEEGVRALPRDGEVLGRRLDSRGFWQAFGIVPEERAFSWPTAPTPSNG
ncbi:uncharacterized protein HMPREF1541_06729 [Cyphellophora europaea CBS 101466]|uniref:NAD-dependent epimerase/dehydratase domain-containing protein n=1 Tax=Cyphellophora europaea (strain CBS 101466) TaxID=1220924 RepID=W2RQE0_CYPE1|nr:uncharacterized protein HMPREF1541_06729 [Cyphellophora europaea CBS 101466]ETN38692.1 hypothetical protein HMPREF1541_06729 [Cyphellophora europaea CBS 101466]